MLVRASFPSRLSLLVPTLALALGGCAETVSGDVALAEVHKLQAEVRAMEARVTWVQTRQNYVEQQVGNYSGVLSTVAKESASRADDLSRKNDEALSRVERLEREEIKRREQTIAEEPSLVLARAQALIDAGRVKVVTKNGRTRLDLVSESTPSPATPPPAAPAKQGPELMDPWANPVKPPAPPRKPRRDDLGF